MERIASLRSCSNCMLTMGVSRCHELETCRRAHSGEPWGGAQPETGYAAINRGAGGADHRRRPGRHVLCALAAQLRPAPGDHREGECAGRDGAPEPLSERVAARPARQERARERGRVRRPRPRAWDRHVARRRAAAPHPREAAMAARPLRGPAPIVGGGGRNRDRHAICGRGVARRGCECAARCSGDNAFDVSRILAEKGVRVTVIMRSKSPKAQPLLIERLRRHQASGLANVVAERTVEALEDVSCGVRLRLDDGRAIDANHVVLLFGYRPNTNEAWLAELAPATDPLGYLVVDGNMETSCRSVFAAGDVANPAHPSIATALGSGAIAARQIATRLAGEIVAPS